MVLHARGLSFAISSSLCLRWINGLAILFPGMALSCAGLTVSDVDVRVSAVMQTNPPQIMLVWPTDDRALRYDVSRKSRDDTTWGDVTSLPASATGFTDTNIEVGTAYEYRIYKAVSPTDGYYGYGYLYGGVQVPLMETRGKVILIADSTVTSALTLELDRLSRDLVGDGWTVLRHDVPRMAVDPADSSTSVWAARLQEISDLKAIIRDDYLSDPTAVKAVFLLGHLPVPYSGNLAPDYHLDHVGAWPADVYYADLSGTWTDVSVSKITASSQRNRNVPGDGKLDQTLIPALVDLEIGRVDMANLPTFQQDEVELLRQYLNKDHAFRHRQTAAEARGLITDNLGLMTGEVPAANGWRNYAPFFGAAGAVPGAWQTDLGSGTFLWAYGCGAGTYTSCSGVTSTAQVAGSDPRVVFTMLFGSYFGDWDSPDNLLRAQLGSPTYTLTCVWASRPNWFFHHMALGETIGFSTRVTQNNNGLYERRNNAHAVHIALMGDPTLRMQIVAPVSGVAAAANGVGGADVTWNASPDTVLGYHVYKSAVAAGPFTRVNEELITGTSYTDAVSSAPCVYMVRGVKLEVSGSGSYYNASTGIFAAFAGAAEPLLTISVQNTNKVYGAALPAFTPVYSGFFDGDTPQSLDAPPVLNTTATPGSPVGEYPIQVSGAASTKYNITYVEGMLTVLPAATSGILSSSRNPALPGVPVTFTLVPSVVPPGAGTPTGLVQFKADGAAIGTPRPLTAGTASYTASTLGHGSHVITAGYAGDANFLGCTNALAVNQVINTPPVARGDTIGRLASSGMKVPVAVLLANDGDPDGDSVTFDGVAGSSVYGGTVTCSDKWVFYTPPEGFIEADTFSYHVKDAYSSVVSGTVSVLIDIDDTAAPNLTITDLGNGSVAIQGDGIPGWTYRIEYATNSEQPDWQLLGAATADLTGYLSFIDTSASPQRFYRTVSP